VIDSFYATLARLGFTDPPHALLTHMPIGLITGALLFFLVAVVFRRKVLVPTARHVSILAFIFIFPTILFGVLDWLHYFRGAMILPIKVKMILAAAVLLITGAGIILGSEIKVHTIPQMVLYALSFVCVVGLGYFGAKLVYGGWSGEKAGAEAPAGQEGAFASGSEVFAANCQACHPNGGNVVDPALPLKNSKRLASLRTFAAFIRSPTMPDGSPGSMPSFGEELISGQQAEDLYLYVSRKNW
jgi:mono/diheme cytochrome c family protein